MSTKQLFDEIVWDRIVIEASEVRLLMKIEEFKKKKITLENENKRFSGELEILSQEQEEQFYIFLVCEQIMISRPNMPTTECPSEYSNL